MKFENQEVFNFEGAIRGMRNPMNSWDKSDSFPNLPYDDRCSNDYPFGMYVVGKNDLSLMQKLIRAGSEHRKFMRQIFVSVDITAPLYWWKEFDTYKVGTVSNSCSTMHKLADTPITIDCFEMSDFENVCGFNADGYGSAKNAWDVLIPILECLRVKYNETKDIDYWKELIRLLPESWQQKRTITMSYENILNMVRQRKDHKLTEWSKSFIDWARSLPYAENLIFLDEVADESKTQTE